MRNILNFHAFLLITLIINLIPIPRAIAQQPDVQQTLEFVPFNQVRMQDDIWACRTRQLVERTLPHAFKETEPALESLRLCGDYLANGGSGPVPTPHRFRTSDLYKVLEGAALMLRAEPNPAIEKQVDRIIDIIARAQKPDGYLYVAHITHSINESEMGPRPYSYLIHSHELYNMGHLYEAAVAYAQATGKTELLDVAEKNARHVNRVFFEGDPNYNDGKPVNQAPGHEEIEIGLVKLYQYTHKRLYLDMAKRFLEIRGVTFIPHGTGVSTPEYAQQHCAVSRQTKAVGHAVRACYLYAAMAEVDSLTRRDDYGKALDSIWHDIVDTKMHISGGLGAVPNIEGFGPSYVLPNKDTYLETCAAVGNVLFNMRMFLKYADSRYVDVAEVALYNNCLAGIGLDGTSFFYPNPLAADEGHAPRSGWFGCACCPSNLARLIPKISGHMYATTDDRLYCALYGENATDLTIGDTRVHVNQTTDYPFDGSIELELTPDRSTVFDLALRIPSWAQSQFVPGELYHFEIPSKNWRLFVNGESVNTGLDRGFAVVKRTWKAGDRVRLELPMPVKASRCIDKVEADRRRVAITRGPLLFSAEQIDNAGNVERIYFDGVPDTDGAKVSIFSEGPLAGLPQVKLAAKEMTPAGNQDMDLTLIPYFAWSNRDRGSMNTWIPTTDRLAKIDYGAAKNLRFAGATASHTWEGDTIEAVRMEHTPGSSFDTSIRRWTSWPERGNPQWVEIDLGESQTVRSVGVYFYDDRGGVQVPGEWHVSVPAGDGWKRVEIYNTDSYSALPDTYNTIHPAEQLKTRRLRIEMKPQHDKTCVGILSVNIETAAN